MNHWLIKQMHKTLKVALLIGLILIVISLPKSASSEFIEHTTEQYYQLLDEEENLLWETGRTINTGVLAHRAFIQVVVRGWRDAKSFSGQRLHPLL